MRLLKLPYPQAEQLFRRMAFNVIAGADLLNEPPDYREINFSNFVVTKPTTITCSFPEINLEIKVFVE